MFSFSRSLVFVSLAALVLLLLAGCVVAPPPGVRAHEIAVDRPGDITGTGPESQDLNRVADKMLRSLLTVPEISNAPAAPRIALLPVENNTRFPINKNIFLNLIKARLNSEARGKMVFLARERMDDVMAERDLKRKGVVQGNAANAARAPKGADYFLTGTLDGMGQASGGGTSDYILYTFKLINAETSEEVWENMEQIKKEGLDDVVYR